jgi:hypothetical protein
MEKSSIVFSGRFDPVHPGHIATVIRLTKKYSLVKVAILDYPGRSYPVSYIGKIFEELLEKYNVDIMSNPTHFGEITPEEWKEFKCNSYAAGNLKVLKHMENIADECVYVDRAYDYSASNYKRLD